MFIVPAARFNIPTTPRGLSAIRAERHKQHVTTPEARPFFWKCIVNLINMFHRLHRLRLALISECGCLLYPDNIKCHQ